MNDETHPQSNAERDMAAVLGLGLNQVTSTKIPRKWWIWGGCGLAALLLFMVFGLFSSEQEQEYRTGDVERGDIVATVTATGALQPVNSVDIGAEVSGQIAEVFVDFNDRVTEGQLLAVLNTDTLRARVLQSRASLAAARAQVEDAKATVSETKDKYERSQELAKTGFVSRQTLDSAEASAARALANLSSAEAQVEVATATLSSDETALSKAEIVSPINGVVLSRSVEPGQVVAASFQTPVLFELAEDLTKMQLEVDVDEADIGQVEEGQNASFVVDAFQNRRYPATITQVRFAPKTVDSVVTYQAVLVLDNDDLSLRPGMTATATITTAASDDALTVPNAALRFDPSMTLDRESRRRGGFFSRMFSRANRDVSDDDKAGQRRSVWLIEDDDLRPVEVEVGITDGQRTEIIKGTLDVGDRVATGTQTPASSP